MTSRSRATDASAPEEQVILVNANDVATGTATKITAHQPPGMLHRAFSVFVFNADGELLLQRRAATKYHFPGLWANTCCGHPRPGEATAEAARRRLVEEMGINTSLQLSFTFSYDATDKISGLVEREIDHVFQGRCDDEPAVNPGEADACKWISAGDLYAAIEESPQRFCPWLLMILRHAQAPRLFNVSDPGDA